MAKTTVFYFTYIDEAGVVRPRRAGTLEAIENTGLEGINLLTSTALEVDESELDDDGFYPQLDRRTERVWLFQYLITASIHGHFRPMPHESASYSRGYGHTHPAW
jgi:hypothetical protein